MLKKVGSKGIAVDGQSYRYVVSEVDTSRAPSISIALTVQHASANGSRLRVTGLNVLRVPESESKFYVGRTLAAPLLPRHVEYLIRLALQRGWKPQMSGKQFAVELALDEAIADEL
jgi:hypothetical protein